MASDQDPAQKKRRDFNPSGIGVQEAEEQETLPQGAHPLLGRSWDDVPRGPVDSGRGTWHSRTHALH